MKLITAIINKKDTSSVCDSLRDAGYYFTKLSSSGGFLRDGNTTLLIGVDDDKLEPALEVVRLHCKKRMEQAQMLMGTAGNASAFNYTAAKIMVGGATIFVSDIEHFEKI